MESFIKKLDQLHFFLVEKNGELILKKHKNRSVTNPYDFKEDKENIKDFLTKNKIALIEFLKEQKIQNNTSNVIYKLSPLQEGMLFHGLYDKNSNAYILQLAIEFTKGVDVTVIKSSWEYVLQHYSILRTAFFHEDFSIPVQRVYEQVTMPFIELDYSSFSTAEKKNKIASFLLSDRERGFKFNEVPLMRVTLIKTGETSYNMVFTSHHILMDGWSLSILMGDFLQAYQSLYKGKKLPTKSIDYYEDYIRYIASKDPEEETSFWKTYMEGLTSPCLLPFSKKQIVQQDQNKDYRESSLLIDASLTDQLKKYARSNRLTVNTIIQGVWAFLLHTYTANDTIVFGVTVSGRPKAIENADQRVGLYINTLPLCTTIDASQKITEWLSDIQLQHTTSREYQYINLSEIQKLNGIKGSLFDSIIVFENFPVSDAVKEQEGILELGAVEAKEQTNYLLTLTIGLGETLDIKFTYNDVLLSPFYVQSIQGHIKTILEQLTSIPEDSTTSTLQVLTPNENHQIQYDFNNTEVAYPLDKTLLDLINDQVNKTPNAIAVRFEEQQLSYSELEEKSNQLAHHLRSRGVTTESLVGVCLDRSLHMMVSILGILKSGGAYVPIDPDYPEERIQYIIQDIAAQVILCDSRSIDILTAVTDQVALIDVSHKKLELENYPITKVPTTITPSNLAYVIYTSGSTGKPKGVMNEHRGIVNRLLWTQNQYQLQPNVDAILQKTTFCFDVSVWELFWPLISGVPLVFLRPEGHKDTTYLKQTIDNYNITTLHFVPSMLWAFLLDIEKGECTSLQRVLCSGEALRLDQIQLFKEKFPKVRLDNLYGPTEAAIDVSSWRIPEGNTLELVSIGKPIANTRLYILDKNYIPVPIGVSGDLYIGGVQVARGYLNREELTQEKFITNPFMDGERMYDTGDVARWLPDGTIEYIGRSDDQVKIRGYRIELGEIESILSQISDINTCCVLAKESSDGSKQLVGYVVSKNVFDKVKMQEVLQQKLPEYMIPQLWVELDDMPLTSNGKTDKKVLSTLNISNLNTVTYEAPRDELEKELVTIWQNLLNIDKVGIQDDFFDLGGHSILATRLVSIIRKKVEVEIEIKDVFNYPTIKTLKKQIINSQQKTITSAIQPRDTEGKVPLSFSQERLWFVDQLGGSIHYHIPIVLRIKGNLDITILETSLRQILYRHKALRTIIKSEEGIGYQEVISEKDWNIRHFTVDGKQENLEDKIEKFISHPFNLSIDYMFRAGIYDQGADNYVLTGVFHHIASDGWSIGILIQEFIELYSSFVEKREDKLPPLSVQYSDYAFWQREYLEGEILQQELSYWEHQLKKVSSLNLPIDYPRPSIQSTKGADISFTVDLETTKKIKAICKEEGVTLFMLLLSAFKVLLYRNTGQSDISIGTPIANRTQEETEKIIGFFANTLVLRNNISKSVVFKELLRQVKTTTLEAYEHQHTPFEKVVDRVIEKRDMSISPLFQVMFTLQNAVNDDVITLPEVTLSSEPFRTTISQFDLTLTVTETNSGLSLNLTYATALFKEETIQRLKSQYEILMKNLEVELEYPIDKMTLLTGQEKYQLLDEFNNTYADYPLDNALPVFFENQVAKTPDAIAVIFEEEQLSYRELDERSNQLANYLNREDTIKEEIVGICLNRSLEMVISILGVLKSGRAYVPIDPNYPKDRITYILEDAFISLIISNSESIKALGNEYKTTTILLDTDGDEIQKESINKPSLHIDENQLAYVIYTSGSTGNPKGVMIEHKSVVNFLYSMINKLGLEKMKTFLSVTTYTFDIFYLELFTPLIQGAKVVLSNEESSVDAYKLRDLITTYQPEFMQATPSTWQMLVSSDWNNEENVTILCGGEAIKENLKNSLTTISSTVWNLYGPTEATIWVTAQKLERSETINIGTPIDNTRAYIVSDSMQLQPIGVIGELCFSGIGISRGYLNKESLTEDRFISDPFTSGLRLYKTGDLARWLSDGNIEFLGRKDDQVKIRGYRIELGEIESVLSELPSITSCCVVSRADGSGSNRLVGYVVSSDAIDKSSIQSHLKTRLPDYMIPGVWVTLEDMPLTSNGKIDKKSLPDPDMSDVSSSVYVAPQSAMEISLAEIWQELLGVPKVGIHDNFFELGGHSLLATRLVSMIRKRLEVEVSIREIFDNPMISDLVVCIEGGVGKVSLPSVVHEDKIGS
uniref:non-ribosomal peptide synthetase n=1 Tax=Aquimarina longa TaxID=1080221 RepID=UPI0007822423